MSDAIMVDVPVLVDVVEGAYRYRNDDDTVGECIGCGMSLIGDHDLGCSVFRLIQLLASRGVDVRVGG